MHLIMCPRLSRRAPLFLLISAHLLAVLFSHATGAPDLLLKVGFLARGLLLSVLFPINLAFFFPLDLDAEERPPLSFSLSQNKQTTPRAAPSSTATPPSAPTSSCAPGRSPLWGWTSTPRRRRRLLLPRGSQSFSPQPAPATNQKKPPQQQTASRQSTARASSSSRAPSTRTPTWTPR